MSTGAENIMVKWLRRRGLIDIIHSEEDDSGKLVRAYLGFPRLGSKVADIIGLVPNERNPETVYVVDSKGTVAPEKALAQLGNTIVGVFQKYEHVMLAVPVVSTSVQPGRGELRFEPMKESKLYILRSGKMNEAVHPICEVGAPWDRWKPHLATMNVYGIAKS